MRQRIWLTTRFTIFSLINFIFWPVLLKPILKMKRGLFSYIFLTYPGEVTQAKGYIPLSFRKLIPLVTVIGIVTGKKGRWGLVVSTPWTAEEIQGKRFLQNLTHNTVKLAEDIGAKTVVLAGRLPSLLSMEKERDTYSKIISAGREGTLYTVSSVLSSLIKVNGLNRNKAVNIGIVGYGFIGLNLLSRLRDCDGMGEIVVFDPKIERERKIKMTLMTNKPGNLEICDIVILLTERGEQIEGIIDNLKPQVIVIDETHPEIPDRMIANIVRNKQGKVIKATLRLNGVKFIPRLPRWDSDWIPGCCLAGIVDNSNMSSLSYNSEQFKTYADKLGFQAPLVANKNRL